MESLLEKSKTEIKEPFPTDPKPLKRKIFQLTWNAIEQAKDAAGGAMYTIPAPLDMTAKGGVWGEAQPSQPSP
eukprot:9253430-Karenia_brevis.AAC.1